jgi:hypothetical protein
MKTTVFLLILSSLFSSIKAVSQTTFVYFKASQAYITIGNDQNLKGPIANTDIVTINSEQGEITFLSGAARVYKIIKVEYKKAENNNPFTEYIAKDREGNQIRLSQIKIVDKKDYDTRIIFINLDGTGLTALEGNVHNVF